MFTTILFSLAVVLYLAVAIVLVRTFMRERNVGFIWLGVAVILWPGISSFIDQVNRMFIDRISSGQPVGFFPYSLVQHGQMTIGSLFQSLSLLKLLIGSGLMLVAVLYLGRTKTNRNPPTLV